MVVHVFTCLLRSKGAKFKILMDSSVEHVFSNSVTCEALPSHIMSYYNKLRTSLLLNKWLLVLKLLVNYFFSRVLVCRKRICLLRSNAVMLLTLLNRQTFSFSLSFNFSFISFAFCLFLVMT